MSRIEKHPHLLNIYEILDVSKEELVSRPIGYLRNILRDKTTESINVDHMDYQVLDDLLSKTRRREKKNQYADIHKKNYEAQISCLSDDLTFLFRERHMLLQMKLDLFNQVNFYKAAICNVSQYYC